MRQSSAVFISSASNEAVAKTGDAAAIELLTKILIEGTIHDDERAYFLALVAYHRGQTNEARAHFSALADASKLTAMELKAIADLCKEQQMSAERLKVLHRLAGGGYGSGPRVEALGELAKLHAQAGDLERALSAFGELQGSWGKALVEDVREAIAESVTADNFAQFKAALLQLMQKAPDHDRVSNLLGLSQQIAQRFGKADTAAALAAEAKVIGLEYDETVAWDGLLENWEIAGPYSNEGKESASAPSGRSRSDSSTADDTAAAARDLAIAAVERNWKKTDPKQLLGIVRFGRVLGLGSAELNNQVAYARTTINSPEARAATFCLGSSDWVRVWVNDELVHSGADTRPCALDQDRFTVPLKKGTNSLLLKVSNVSDDWSFCLRVAEGREGLVLAGVE